MTIRSDILHRDQEGSPFVGREPRASQRELEHELLTGAQAESNLRGMQHLVTVVQRLGQARNLQSIMAIVRRAVRELLHADGATFILRDHNLCFYADEDAISPLWKGQRFPMSACISGWSMLNRQVAVIEDIYADSRIPHDAYRPTFVKSLVMMPIRTVEPVGAIGVYWSARHKPTSDELGLLQALADSTSVAMDAANQFASLEKRVADRSEELARRSAEVELLSRELETFSYSVAHDLRAPLITIDGFAQVLQETAADSLDEASLSHLGHIQTGVARMHRLIEELMGLSKIMRVPMTKATVNLSTIAGEIAQRLRGSAPERVVDFVIAPNLKAQGDTTLLRMMLDHLLSNSWKFTSKRDHAHIELDTVHGAEGGTVFRVKDNGAGFDPRYATRLFGPFQRCHSQQDFPGSGIGLATAQRIVHRHGGKIWVEAQLDRGASFYFTLPGTVPVAPAGELTAID